MGVPSTKICAAFVRPVTQSRQGARFIVEVHTNDGLIGSAFLASAPSDRFRALVAETLVGEDPRAVTSHWQRLAAANERCDRALTAEIAAIDIALWDLKAKLHEQPLWRTLGGMRPKVNAHMRLPAAARASDELNTWSAGVLASGVRGIVIDASSDPHQDAHTLLTLRSALGAGIERAYTLDAQEQWSPKDAVRAITTIEDAVDLTWVASPTHRNDFLGHKRIVAAVRSAVCSGGRLTSAAEFLPHLHHHAINVVQLDVAKIGITAALQIADAAYGFELPIALTTSIGNLHVHVASALVYCACIEWSADTSVRSDVRLDQGWVVAGDAIGHGITMDSAASAHR